MTEGDELLVFDGDLVKPIQSIEPSVPAPPQPRQKKAISRPETAAAQEEGHEEKLSPSA